MRHCAKCGRPDDGWLGVAGNLGAFLCINCVDRFNAWCETHPHEPFTNFIQPKPWEPSYPGLIMFEVGGKMHAHMPSEDWWGIFWGPEEYFDMTDETAELSSEMSQLLLIALQADLDGDVANV